MVDVARPPLAADAPEVTFEQWWTERNKRAAALRSRSARNDALDALRRREAVYEAVRSWNRPGKVSLSGAAHAVASSRPTLNRDFDATAAWRGFEPVANMIAECVEWSFQPYEDGLRAGLLRAGLNPRLAVEAAMIVLAAWAYDHPHLTQRQQTGPFQACVVLTEIDPHMSVQGALEAVHATVTDCRDDPTGTPLGILGTVRQRLYPLPPRTVAPAARARVEEALLAYADQLREMLDDGEVVDADSDIRPVLGRVSRLLDMP